MYSTKPINDPIDFEGKVKFIMTFALADYVTEDRKEEMGDDMLEFEPIIFDTKNMFDSPKIKELDQINDILVHDDNTLTIEITYNCIVTCNDWWPGDKFNLDPGCQSETTCEYAELEGFEYDSHNKECAVSDDIKSKILKNINSYLEHYYLLKNPDSQYKPELVKLIKIDREDFKIPELGD